MQMVYLKSHFSAPFSNQKFLQKSRVSFKKDTFATTQTSFFIIIPENPMKKTTTFLLLVLFAFSVSAQVTEFNYYFGAPKIEIQGASQTINFSNTLLQGIPGEPLLPYQAVNLLIPPGHEAVGITVTGNDEVILDGFFKLAPAQFSRPLSEESLFPATEKEEIYTSDKIYPNTSRGNLSTQYMNGFGFAQTVITPIKYVPSEGRLSYFKSVTVRLETRETVRGTAALKNLTSSESVRKQATKSAQNLTMATSYPSPKASANDYQILIVSPQIFSNALIPLKDLYLPRGLKSQFVSIETIQTGGSGTDLPEKIRNYIIEQYQQFGIEHVVLAGDVEHVPYRGFYCTVQSSSVYTDDDIPSDLYYSALDGNWNTNQNALWGEIGEDDLLPDISVGRLSFSSATELAAMLNKTTKYQNSPIQGELRMPLMAGENLYTGPDTWGSDYLELLIGTHSDNGYTTTGIPEDHNIVRLYDEIQNWSPSMLMATINTGPNYIHHVGHANTDYTMKLYNSDITNANFSGVNGVLHNFPIVYTHGCICGAFDANDCIGERMVAIDNFASVFIGNSRYGWFNEGQTEGPSAHMHREFVDALFSDSLNRIGRAHMESKIETAPWVNAPGQWEEGALRWCFYDCNVLGDPVMAAWTDEPIGIVTEYPASITNGSAQFEVTVTTGGLPAKGLTAALLRDGVLYGTGITNSNGVATVAIDPVIVEPGDAQLVISGYNCLPTYYTVVFISGDSPYVVYGGCQIIDVGGNNNGLPDYGESINLEVIMQNIGQMDATNVEVTLASDSPYITITDDHENYGTIAGGGSIALTGFSFDISQDVPDNQMVEFNITAQSGDDTWNSTFQIFLLAPAIDAGNAEVSDPTGNNNSLPDPGETIDLGITIMNRGGSTALPMNGTLICNNALVNIPQNISDAFTLLPGYQTQIFFESISISPEILVGTPLLFSLTVSTIEQPQIVIQKDYAFVVGQIIEDFETGNFLMHPWQHGGNANWTISGTNPFEGEFSARSGNISGNQQSELLVPCNVLTSDSISFYFKVSSEEGYDFLRFYIDNTKKGEWSGTRGWSRASFPVQVGQHNFRWVYNKDIGVNTGEDAGWIDYIVFPPIATEVGIAENRIPDAGLLVFPNPANETLTIYTGKCDYNAVIRVIDISGRTILEFHDVSPGQYLKADVSGVAPGIYILTNSGKTTLKTMKLIIQ